jgi:UDP-glucose 4-epimerase
MSRILVTGGAGFIGSHLGDALLARGDDVIVLDDLTTGSRENIPEGATFVEGSVTDMDLLRRVLTEDVDAVLHVAGQASISRSYANPEHDLQVNVAGTLNVIEASVAAGVGRLVYAGSMTSYGQPLELPTPESHACVPVSNYGVTKYAAERYVQVAGARDDVDLAVTTLRMFNVYGERQSLTNPYQGVLAIFLGAILRGEPVTIHGDGKQTRDFVYIADVVDAWLRVLDEPRAAGAVFNVGSGRETSVNDLLAAVLAAAEVIPEALSVQRGPTQPGDQRRACADVAALEAATGWRARTTLQDGIDSTVAWARGNVSSAR